MYGDDRAASVLGYVTAAMTLAPLVGPMIGGYLIDTTGWRSVFYMVAGVATLLFLLLAARLPETRSPSAQPTHSGPNVGAFRALLVNGPYLRYLLFGATLTPSP